MEPEPTLKSDFLLEILIPTGGKGGFSAPSFRINSIYLRGRLEGKLTSVINPALYLRLLDGQAQHCKASVGNRNVGAHMSRDFLILGFVFCFLIIITGTLKRITLDAPDNRAF